MERIVVTDQAAGTAGMKLVERREPLAATTADEHRQRLGPRRCRRHLQLDRATRGEDGHPHCLSAPTASLRTDLNGDTGAAQPAVAVRVLSEQFWW